MSITLPLDAMTVTEKLQVMEALWADLCRTDEAVESPDWHREVLVEREERIDTGQSGFTAWEQAKAEIRTRLQ